MSAQTISRPTAPVQPTQGHVAATMRTMLAEGNAVFYERGNPLEAAFIALLAGANIFWLGKPGTGKSYLVRWVCEAFTGARYFESQLHRQLPLEDLFGSIDMPLYDKTGVWRRNTTGMMPEAEIVYLDEIGKAGASTTNPILAVANEHIFHNCGVVQPTPTISLFASSNEELEMPEQAAMWDRFPIRQVIDPIQEDGHMADFLRSKVVRGPAPQRTTLDLADLLYAKDVEVPAIDVPDGIIDTLLSLKRNLAGEEIYPSDRRWGQCIRILQATAYLAGRTAVDDDDIQILQHVLWEDMSLIGKVEQQVLSLTSELVRDALDLEQQIQEIIVEIAAAKGQSSAKRAPLATTSRFKLKEINESLQKLVKDAKKSGRSTTRLESVRDLARQASIRISTDLMEFDEARARAIVAAEVDPLDSV